MTRILSSYPMTTEDAYIIGESVAWARYYSKEESGVYRAQLFRREVRDRPNRVELEEAFASGYRDEYRRLEG